MRRLNVGIIGVGHQGRVHLERYHLIPEKVEVKAVSDVSASIAEEVAKKYGIKTWYTDYTELLKRPDIDAVSICVPGKFHRQIAVAAAEAGKHILLEKPMAFSLEEADTIIDSADKAGVKLMAGYNQIFNPMVRHTRELIQDGILGKLSLVKTQYVRSIVGTPREKFGWRASIKQAGGGVIIESGIHRISLSVYLGGAVEKVSAFTERLAMDIDGEDNAVIALTYKGGGLGVVTCSWVSEFKGPEWEKIEVYGTEGSVIGYGDTRSGVAHLELSRANMPEYGRLHSYFPPEHVFKGGFDSFKDEIEHFVDCIINDTEPIVDGHFGRAILEIVLAAYQSSEKQKVIKLP